jgi:hypothetical protein
MRFARALLAEMPPAVLAAEPAAGDADKTVAAGVILTADRGGGDGSRRADREIAGPEAAVVVEAVIAALLGAALPGGIPIRPDRDRSDADSCRHSWGFPVLCSGSWRLDRTARISRDYR